jgi:hypothetical protein
MPGQYWWIGGTTLGYGISGAAYDWNSPANWRQLSSLGNTPTFVVAKDTPGFGDVVNIGAYSKTGENGVWDAYYPNGEFKPVAPLLWGGYKTISGMTGTGIWIYGGLTGATSSYIGNGITGALRNLQITIGRDALPQSTTLNTYPFPSLGVPASQIEGPTTSSLPPIASVYLADHLYWGLGLTAYSQAEWKYAIDNNLVSASGLTGLYVKAKEVKINSLPNPGGLGTYKRTAVNINFVDNINIAPTPTVFGSRYKYDTAVSVNISGNVIYFNNCNLNSLYLEGYVPGYKSAEAGVYIINSNILYFQTRTAWFNLWMNNSCKIGNANIELIGPEFQSPDNIQWLSDDYVKSVYGGLNQGYRPSKLISGTYSKSLVFPLFGITSPGSTGYIESNPISLNLELNGTAVSPDLDFHDSSSGNFFGMKGAVYVGGITADGMLIQGDQIAPEHFYTWNPRTGQFECRNQQTYGESCSNGQMEDYLRTVLFTSWSNNINLLNLMFARIIPVLPFSTDTRPSGDQIQTFNIGKMTLSRSILELSQFGPNIIYWDPTSSTDPGYAEQQEPDWKFGVISNSATGVTLDGGLVFYDEYSQVRGARNVRLLNYVVNKTTNKNNRTNSVLNEIVGNKIPTISGGSAQSL